LPVAPLTPVEPEDETDLDERLSFRDSWVATFFSFLIEVSFFSLDVLRNVTSKTEYNEENKSFTITQIVSTSLIDEGRGF